MAEHTYNNLRTTPETKWHRAVWGTNGEDEYLYIPAISDVINYLIGNPAVTVGNNINSRRSVESNLWPWPFHHDDDSYMVIGYADYFTNPHKKISASGYLGVALNGDLYEQQLISKILIDYPYVNSNTWIGGDLANYKINISSEGEVRNMSDAQIDLKTFAGVMAVRSLSGTVRVAEHHLLNGVSTTSKSTMLIVKNPPLDIVMRVAGYFQNEGYLTESRRHKDDEATGTLLCFNVSGTRLNCLILFRFSEKSIQVDSFVASDVEEQINHHLEGYKLVVEQWVIQKPLKINYVVGIGDNGAKTDLRELSREGDLPLDCHYPYIEGGVQQLVDGFATSKNNLLFMMGDWRTGKSTLVSHICREYSSRQIYFFVGDTVLLDPRFPTILGTLPDHSLIIIEDGDNFVRSRADGNMSMSLLLNELSGVVTKDLKIIITSNIKDINDVDGALLAPGRCYASIRTRVLTKDEAQVVADHHGIDNIEIKNGMSLGDILVRTGQRIEQSSFGFGG